MITFSGGFEGVLYVKSGGHLFVGSLELFKTGLGLTKNGLDVGSLLLGLVVDLCRLCVYLRSPCDGMSYLFDVDLDSVEQLAVFFADF